MAIILLKRVYEAAEKKDGFRVLVDRLWPRGLRKEALHADVWMKEIAPSPALRKWFNHDPEKWIAFSKAYNLELKRSELPELAAYCKKQTTITLLYAAKDEKHNHAVVLQRFLKNMQKNK